MQRDSETKHLYVIGYASRSLRPGERNYVTFQLEAAALTFGCRAFHTHLWGKEILGLDRSPRDSGSGEIAVD